MKILLILGSAIVFTPLLALDRQRIIVDDALRQAAYSREKPAPDLRGTISASVKNILGGIFRILLGEAAHISTATDRKGPYAPELDSQHGPLAVLTENNRTGARKQRCKVFLDYLVKTMTDILTGTQGLEVTLANLLKLEFCLRLTTLTTCLGYPQETPAAFALDIGRANQAVKDLIKLAIAKGAIIITGQPVFHPDTVEAFDQLFN